MTSVFREDSLDAFTRQYIETALWSSLDDNGEPLDRYYAIDDLAEETFLQMCADCRDFQEQNESLLAEMDDERAGHCFWLTRNRHGTGFWDEESLTESAQTLLTNASHRFGEVDLYVGDDKKVYLD